MKFAWISFLLLKRKLSPIITIYNIIKQSRTRHNNMADAAILHGALERIGWSVKSRKAFTDEGFDSIQSLSHVTWSHLKTVCKSIGSAPNPVRIGFYQEYKLYALHHWVTTRLLQGQVVQGQQFTDAIALEYASKVYCLEESKKED